METVIKEKMHLKAIAQGLIFISKGKCVHAVLKVIKESWISLEVSEAE